MADLLAVADASLDDPWRWRATDPEDVELRYGFYGSTSASRRRSGRSRSDGPGGGESIGPAVPPLAAMAAARWELRGALAPLGEDAWDADPGGGEWTIRQTFGHIVNGQRSYGWYNAWYLNDGVVGVETVRPSEDVLPPEPTEEEEAAGPPATRPGAPRRCGRREYRGGGGPRCANHGRERPVGRAAGDDRLPAGALRLPHPRAHRRRSTRHSRCWAAGRPRSSGCVRLILATYGRLEGLLVGRRPDDLERPLETGASPVEILAAAMTDVESTAASVRAASGG